MTKRGVLLLLFLSSVLFLSAEDLFFTDHNGNELFFYEPSNDAMNHYFTTFYPYLNALEDGSLELTEENLEIMFDSYYQAVHMHSLLFESFLLNTQNKVIQDQILTYLTENKIDDEFAKSLERKYNSEKTVNSMFGKEMIQYNYGDTYFDENINLFNAGESYTFEDKGLGLLLFENDWQQIPMNDPNNESNGHGFLLIHGGNSNSLVITLKEFPDTEYEDFFNQEINSEFNKQKFANWTTEMIIPEGILERAGADFIFIGVGTGPSEIAGIEDAMFTLYLFNLAKNKGYTVTYFMNMAESNNNYPIRHRIWNRLLMQLNLAFINMK